MTNRSGRQRLLVALLLATMSASGVFVFLSLRSEPAARTVQAQDVATEAVVVATRDLEPGAEIAEGDVEVRQVPVEQKIVGVVERSEDAIGRIASAGLVAGEQVLSSRLGDEPADGPETFAQGVPVGLRAVTIEADEVSLVGGLVQPGDRVDVLGYWEIEVTAVDLGFGAPALGGGNAERPEEGADEGDGNQDAGSDTGGDGEAQEYTQYASAYVVQDAEVLAVAQALTPGDSGLVDAAAAAAVPTEVPAETASAPVVGPQPTAPPVVRPAALSVTLLLTPDEANRVMLAANTTEVPLRLALRAPGDETTYAIGPDQLGEIPLGNLLGDADQPLDQAPAEALAQVSPLQMTDASFLRRSLRVGEDLEFSVTVKNVSDQTILAGEGGAPSGYSYDQNEAYDSLGFFERPGAFRIGVNVAGPTDGQPYPYRWSVDRDLAPGESMTIAGAVRLTERSEGTRFWIGLLAEPDIVLQDGVAVTEVAVTMPTRVRVVAERAQLRVAPAPTATTLVEPELGSVLRVVGQQGTFFQVELNGTTGWVSVNDVEAVAGDASAPVVVDAGATPAPATGSGG